MAWRIVVQPNGKYARFSEVVDDFTHMNLTREEAIEVCAEHDMSPLGAKAKVERGEKEKERWGEALRIIERQHGSDRKAAATFYDHTGQPFGEEDAVQGE